MTKKSPTSVSPLSISSTRKTSASACKSRGADAVAAGVAEAAADAEAADAASVADAAVAVSVLLDARRAPSRVAVHRGAAAACAKLQHLPSSVPTIHDLLAGFAINPANFFVFRYVVFLATFAAPASAACRWRASVFQLNREVLALDDLFAMRRQSDVTGNRIRVLTR